MYWSLSLQCVSPLRTPTWLWTRLTRFLQVWLSTFGSHALRWKTIMFTEEKKQYVFDGHVSLFDLCQKLKRHWGYRRVTPSMGRVTASRERSVRAPKSTFTRRSLFDKISQREILFHNMCLCGLISSCQSVTMATSITTRWSATMEATLECYDGPNVWRHDCLVVKNPLKVDCVMEKKRSLQEKEHNDFWKYFSIFLSASHK